MPAVYIDSETQGAGVATIISATKRQVNLDGY